LAASALALGTVFTALLLGMTSFGGGVYETLLVDKVWPDNPALIQPHRSGLNRKRFWMPFHLAFEIALVLSLWAAWPERSARFWIVVALASHFIMRVWSFAYFIPRAVQFERANHLSAEQVEGARQWTRLSRWRLLLDFASIAALIVVLIAMPRA
jgi:hypothetical protein